MKSFKEYYLLNEDHNPSSIIKLANYIIEEINKNPVVKTIKPKLDSYISNYKDFLNNSTKNSNYKEAKDTINKILKVLEDEDTDSYFKENPEIKKIISTLKKINNDNASTKENKEFTFEKKLSEPEKDSQRENIIKILNNLETIPITNTCKDIISYINKYTNDGVLTFEDLKKAFAYSNNDKGKNTSEQLQFILKIICLIALYNNNAITDNTGKEERFLVGGPSEKTVRSSLKPELGDAIRASINQLKLKHNFKLGNGLNNLNKSITKTELETKLKSLCDNLISLNKEDLKKDYNKQNLSKEIKSAKSKEELENLKNNFNNYFDENLEALYNKKLKSFTDNNQANADADTNISPSEEEKKDDNRTEEEKLEILKNARDEDGLKDLDKEFVLKNRDKIRNFAGKQEYLIKLEAGPKLSDKDISRDTNDSGENEELLSSKGPQFRPRYTDTKDELQDKIEKFFGTGMDDENSGYYAKVYLKKIESARERFKKGQEELDHAKERSKRDISVAEAIIEKDTQILNEFNLKLSLKKNLHRPGRINQEREENTEGNKSRDSSWEKYYDIVKEYANNYRKKIQKLFKNGIEGWDTTPTLEKQKICQKLGLYSINLQKDLYTTYEAAKKANSWNELGKIKRDIILSKENRKDKKEAKFRDSREGRTLAIDLKHFKEGIPNFKENFKNFNGRKNLFAYLIIHPQNYKLKDPFSKKNTLLDSLKEELRKEEGDIFRFGDGSNALKFLDILQKEFGKDEDIINLSDQFNIKIGEDIFNNMKDYFSKSIKAYNQIIANEASQKKNSQNQQDVEQAREYLKNQHSSNDFDVNNNKDELGTKDAANLSVITNESYNKYNKILLEAASTTEAEEVTNSLNNPTYKDLEILLTKPSTSQEYKSSMEKYSDICLREMKDKMSRQAIYPYIHKSFESAKKENINEVKTILNNLHNLGRYNSALDVTKDAAKKAFNTTTNVINKKFIQPGKEYANQKLNNFKQEIAARTANANATKTSVTTDAVGDTVIPQRLYNKVVRRKLNK